MSFSTRIAERRVQLKISQKELAKRIGVTPTRLNYWEKGKREPNMYYISAIAQALDVSCDYLLEKSENASVPSSIEEAVGERIKMARLNKEYTQKQLADIIGVAKTTITGYEKGNREPSLSNLVALATALGVSGDYLLGIEHKCSPSLGTVVTDSELGESEPCKQKQMNCMELYKVLSNRRRELGMKIEELSAKSGIPENTLKKVLTGITANPGISTVKAIVSALNMTLCQLDEQIEVADNLSSEEIKLLSDYRAMDDRSKKFVRMVIDYELGRAHPEDAPAQQTARDVLGDKPRNQLARSNLAQAE